MFRNRIWFDRLSFKNAGFEGSILYSTHMQESGGSNFLSAAVKDWTECVFCDIVGAGIWLTIRIASTGKQRYKMYWEIILRVKIQIQSM